MIDRFVSYRTGPAAHPGDVGAVIRGDRDGGIEMVNLHWGFAPAVRGGRPWTHLRSEGRHFTRGRCLVPASEFHITKGAGDMRREWRVSLATGDWFYMAAIWRPASAHWPASYAVVTIAANPDIAPIHDRQVAVIRRCDRWGWLDHLAPETVLLAPHPIRSFLVEPVEGPQPAFASAAD